MRSIAALLAMSGLMLAQQPAKNAPTQSRETGEKSAGSGASPNYDTNMLAFASGREESARRKLAALQEEIVKEQRNLTQLRARYATSHPDVAAAMQRLGERTEQMVQAEREFADARAKVELWAQVRNGRETEKAQGPDRTPPPSAPAGSREDLAQRKVDAARAEIVKEAQNLRKLRERYEVTHPEVVALNRRLQTLTNQMYDAGMELNEVQVEAWRARKNAKAGQSQPGPSSSAASNVALPDRWWRDDATAQRVGLSADQRKRMDEVFQQYRLRLIDLNAALEKEEVLLEPLVAETVDEAKASAQIDRVAQARAELEKATGRMLLSVRKVLTVEQWRKLHERPAGFGPGSGFGAGRGIGNGVVFDRSVVTPKN